MLYIVRIIQVWDYLGPLGATCRMSSGHGHHGQAPGEWVPDWSSNDEG